MFTASSSFWSFASASDSAPSLDDLFPRYTAFPTTVPVYAIPSERCIHRFFDTSPISPSGRWLALFRVPYEDRLPAPGDLGEVVLVDLHTGQERVVAETRGWEFQVGANVQWGASDSELYFNDVDTQTWEAFAVCLDPESGHSRRLEGTVFMVSPDGTMLASHNLIKSPLAQSGYGVIVPDAYVTENLGPVDDDGIYVTDTKTGKSRMLVSIAELYRETASILNIAHPERLKFYCFQTKWNPQGTRLLTTMQWRGPRTRFGRTRCVLTMNADGSNITVAITPDQWRPGAHHINWHPDGEHVTMNMRMDGDPKLPIIQVRYDGSDLTILYPKGSGHPSFHPDGRYMITDTYGSVSPIRLIDIATGTEQAITQVFGSNESDRKLRVDPHPAWGRSGRFLVFNHRVDGSRRVCLADLRGVLLPSKPV